MPKDGSVKYYKKVIKNAEQLRNAGALSRRSVVAAN
jgi:hypothetical protein